MTDKFLKAKHWQLFLLTFGIPMIFQVVMMGTMIAKIGSENNAEPNFIFGYFKFILIMIFVFMAFLLGWYWSVAVGLQRIIPAEIRLKVNRFKILLIIPIVYILFFFGFFMTSFATGEPDPRIFAVIIPLHLFSMICIFYCLYFVAKTFKTAELQRNVTFSDFAGELFMIWFYPIGIWIIQPKINKMVNEQPLTNTID